MAIFNDARLKVEGAKKRIGELEAAIGAFAKTDYCRLRTHTDPNTGDNVVWGEMVRQLPGDIPLTAGDAAHNLRSALDLMYYELVGLLPGITPGRKTKFPFRDTRQALVTAFNKGKMKGLIPKAIVDAIVDGIKPYKTGNPALWGLNRLDIGDKHHRVIPTIAVAEIESTFNVSLGGVTISRIATWELTSTGPQTPITAPADFEITGEYQPTLDVVFAETTPFKRQSVIPTLTQLALVVDDTINDMAKAYLATLP